MRDTEGEDLKGYIMHTKVLRWLIKCHRFDVVLLREYIYQLIQLQAQLVLPYDSSLT